VLNFDEVIDVASFTATGLTLSDDLPLFASTSVALTNGTIVETEGNTTLTVQLTTYDLNQVKAAPVCTKRTDCYLRLSNVSFADFAENLLVPTADDSALVVSETFVKDETRPELDSFTIDMNSSILVLTFDETVDAAKLIRSGITLLSAQNSSDTVTLAACDDLICTVSSSGTTIEVDISTDDLNKIKLLEFATNTSNSFISISDRAIKDTALSPNKVVAVLSSAAIVASVHTPDTRPALLLFRVHRPFQTPTTHHTG
jgi:hypothetical protein